MKTLFSLAFSLLMAASASAADKPTVKCSDDQTEVTLYKVGSNEYRAVVETEVAGGGRESYRYKDIAKQQVHRIGGGDMYSGPEFSLGLSYEVRVHASLNVPSIGIRGEILRCEITE